MKKLFIMLPLLFFGVGLFAQTSPSPAEKVEERIDADRPAELQGDSDKRILIGPGSEGGNPVLVVVDGKVVAHGSEVLSGIEPSQVEEVKVLKGDEAIKKYGKKGEYGVVEITMKK